MGRSERVWVLLLVVSLGTLSLAPRAAGEDQVDVLIAAAETALGAKEFDKAAAAFERAWVEKPARLNLLLRAAEAYEKADLDAAALRAYQAARVAYEEQAGASAPDAKAKAGLRKAVKRIKSLGKDEAKELAICSRAAAKLLAFAQENAADAPVVALRALERAAVLSADSEAHRTLLRRLRAQVDIPADRVASPFEGKVASWTNLLAAETFPETHGWTFGDVGLLIDAKGGSAQLAGARRTTTEAFIFEMEVRTKKGYKSQWVVGLVFGREGPKGLSVWLGPKGVDIQKFDGSGGSPLAAVAHALDELDVWHRVSVLVKAGAIEVWIDGEKIATPEIPNGWSQAGQYGLTTQDGLFEIRELRMGAPK